METASSAAPRLGSTTPWAACWSWAFCGGRPKGFGFEMTGRWTILSYEYMGESSNASSGSVNLTAHFFL
ncbi:hypothetical protein WME77_15750 [Sorangium sp. So ce764]|uniref:hypothetical protein n=1 Tax=Sorangium sp. So ce764 TaxID=3133320 RepID=UPI003F5FE603